MPRADQIVERNFESLTGQVLSGGTAVEDVSAQLQEIFNYVQSNFSSSGQFRQELQEAGFTRKPLRFVNSLLPLSSNDESAS